MHPSKTRHDAFDTFPTPFSGKDESRYLVLDEALSEDAASARPSDTCLLDRPDFSIDSDVLTQFQRLAADNESLRLELMRAYERLNVVLEISRDGSSFGNPADLKADLLNRYATTLAAVVLIDDGNACRCAANDFVAGEELGLDPEILRTKLNEEITTVRNESRALILNSDELENRGIVPLHLLLSPLQAESKAPHVIIAARHARQRPFDANDRIASETMLVYGGHIFRNTLILQHLKHASLETVGALANAIEARDHYTGGHSERVGWLAVLTGKALDMSDDELQMLEWSGLLHDVGKIGIPEHILNKPGSLTADEFDHIKRHPRLGYDVLRPISSLEPVLQAVLYHHENWDGTGYPEGLKQDQIPLTARILHVVDIFDALTSTRSYRRRLSVDLALQMLAEGAGRETDPRVTHVFIEAFRTYAKDRPQEYAERFSHL